ncbi:LysR family transcriptional regulator [Hirschia litorea]|uniref:LysR family transcriptional regulator n=1 Tax=Hirschia litorea TaxID=1199156 RepID=A0ABW2II26_9PROT
MIDRYLLRYFLAVVDHGNFSRAAAHLNVAQPTLSVGIGKLEKSLEAKLFHRANRRIHITDAGTQLLEYARRIESDFNQAERAVRGLEPKPVFRFGVLTSISAAIISDAIGNANKIKDDGNSNADYGSRVELIEGSERELTNQLARGRVDAALTLVDRGGERFFEEKLFEEGYSIAMSEHHDLVDQTSIPGEALADNVMIVRRHCEALSETSRHFTERGVRPFFAYRSSNDERVLEMVRAGLGVTIMPDSYRWSGVKMRKLAGFEIVRSIGLIWAPHAEHLSQSSPSLVSVLRKALSKQ